MTYRLMFVIATVLVGATAATAAIAGAPANVNVTIRHQTHHCHAWAAGTGNYAAALNLAVARNGTLTITNNDVMPQRLLQKAGPTVRMSGNASMSHPGAKFSMTFSRPGVYRFVTKAGEDYMKGIRTTGEDNVLTMKVTVR
jgi:hypothetical protein